MTQSTLSLMRYRGGTANYLEVLDSQRSLFSAELTLAHDRNNESKALCSSTKHLAGDGNDGTNDVDENTTKGQDNESCANQ